MNNLVLHCDCTRRTRATIGEAGGSIDRLARGALLPRMPFVRPLVMGTARGT
jgi:hypothetical protein